MKSTIFFIWIGCLMLTALSISNAIAEDGDKNKPELIEMAPMQQGNFGLPSIVPGPYETRETACKKYAKDTVEQLTWLDNMNCGYGSNSSLLISYDFEYNKCMNNIPRKMGEEEFHLSDISKNIKKRQKAIADCICKPYAENAVKQNDKNISLGCGYEEGGRWSSDRNHHYNWCAQGGGSIIEEGSWERFKLARDNDLKKCTIVKIINIEPHKSCKNNYKITLDRSNNFWNGDVLLRLIHQGKVLDEKIILAGSNTGTIGVSHLDPDTQDEGKYNWFATVSLVAYRKKGNKLFKSNEPERKIEVQQYSRPVLRDMSHSRGKVGTKVRVTFSGADLLRPDGRVGMEVFPASGGSVDRNVKLRILSTKTINSFTDRIVAEINIAKNAPLGKREIYIKQCANWIQQAPFYVVDNNVAPPPPTPTPPVGAIDVGACFMLLGSHSSDVTAYAKGQVIKATGNSGKKTFNISKKVPANQLTSSPFPGSRNCITMSASGIIKGLWNITVWTNVTGWMTCKKIKVPRLYVNADFSLSPPMCH